MRVLQLIDSLHTGGAERVAVNLANVLSTHIEQSYLCTTREEGLLKESLSKDVNYLFLNKKKTIDIKAIKTLKRFVKQEQIQVIHAHSSSYFLATIIKLLYPRLKIVWHDHYGNSEFLNTRPTKIIKHCSRYFSHIFSVNRLLEDWAKTNLKSKAVSYLPNFAVKNESTPVTTLKGNQNKRILHLANLRAQKDHITLLEAFKTVKEKHPDWTLHCIGKDFKDDYSKRVKETIKTLNLEANVFVYGSKPDVSHILKQGTIGVLSSESEGLPIALLEYGLAGLPVVATKVGECETVITNNKNGLLVPPKAPETLSQALLYYIENDTKRGEMALGYSKMISSNYSANAQIINIINRYKISIETN